MLFSFKTSVENFIIYKIVKLVSNLIMNLKFTESKILILLVRF